jgi:hypothetical protein
VLVRGQVFRLRVDAEPGEELIAAAEIELGEAVIEVAIGEQQAVAAVLVSIGKVGGIVTATGEGRSEDGREFLV